MFQNIYEGIIYPSDTQLAAADVQYVRDMYDNGVHNFDSYLGQVVSTLKAQNLYNKTIIIIESEHGEDLDEHGYFAHYDVLDTQTHTPLLVVDPRLPQDKGKRIASLASGVDVLPTILNLVGASVPNNLEGKSLMPIIDGKEADGQRNTVYLERTPLWEEAILNIKAAEATKGIQISNSSNDEDIAIRTNKWEYILRLSKPVLEKISWWQFISGKPINIADAELYNLSTDPGETHNVVNQYPSVANQLHQQLINWYAGVQADAPVNPVAPDTQEIQPYP